MSREMWAPDRRVMLQSLGLGLAGASCSGWLPALAARVADDPRRRRHCILLWMAGGPSQTDTFDMKPGHANGGEFKEISTQAAGLKSGMIPVGETVTAYGHRHKNPKTFEIKTERLRWSDRVFNVYPDRT